MEPIKLTLKLKEIPVTLDEKAYTLKELSGEARDKYLTGMSDRVKFTDGKMTGLKNFNGLQASLLALCLYDSDGVLVPMKDLQAFPASTLATLFDAAQELSSLGEGAQKEAKKE